MRGFATYLNTLDPAHEVPSADLLPQRRRRATPYLYSDEEIAALIQAADILRFPLRVATFPTLIGLLAASGLRVGEAIGLDRDDLDHGEGLLVVRSGKFGKSREIPLPPRPSRPSRPISPDATSFVHGLPLPRFSSRLAARGFSTATSTRRSSSSFAAPASCRARARVARASMTCANHGSQRIAGCQDKAHATPGPHRCVDDCTAFAIAFTHVLCT